MQRRAPAALLLKQVFNRGGQLEEGAARRQHSQRLPPGAEEHPAGRDSCDHEDGCGGLDAHRLPRLLLALLLLAVLPRG